MQTNGHSGLPGFSQRMSRLGTETAYAVSEEAKTLASTGAKIYPFHIGDLNFATPEVFVAKLGEAIKQGKTGYCPAAGIQPLREALAEGLGKARGVEYTYENVSVQSGGKPIIGKFLMSVMEEGDEVLYPSPGYPIYESMIKFLGGVAKPYEYIETEHGFELDMAALKAKITDKTKVFIYNNYQNPLGCSSSPAEMKEIAELCVAHNFWVLSDEAYFDIVFDTANHRSIVSLPGMKERTCILHTYSKAFSMTGWRLGAAVGPASLIAQINRINTNDEACTTHFIQYAGLQFLSEEAKAFTKSLVDELRKRRDVLVPLVNQIYGFKTTAPPATFYLFVNVTEAMAATGSESVEQFRKLVLRETGVAVCTREHFGSALAHETQRYFRFAYSGINIAEIEEGLAKLKSFMAKFAKKD